MTNPEITQADREAVNAFHSASFTALFNNGSDKRTASGNLNAAHVLLLEAFARHRMLGAAQERAEIVAWLRRLASDEGQTFQGRNLAAQIAAMNFSDAIERGEYKRSE